MQQITHTYIATAQAPKQKPPEGGLDGINVQ
jgi:hypothetical protein